VPEAVAHGGEFPNRRVEFLGFGGQNLALNPRLVVRCDHPCDLIERESGSAPHPDQCQTLQDTGIEHPMQAAPANGPYQLLFFIKAQRRGRQSGNAGILP